MEEAKSNRKSNGAKNSFLEMSPTHNRTPKKNPKGALQIDTHTPKLSLTRLEVPARSSEKKRKKSEGSTLQAEEHRENKKKKLRDEDVTHNPQLDLENADGSLNEMSPYETSPKKKKKREKLRQSGEDISYEVSAGDGSGGSREKKRKSSRESRSVDLPEAQTNEKNEEHVRKDKVRRKDSSILAKQFQDVEPASSATQKKRKVKNREMKSNKKLASHVKHTDTGVASRNCNTENVLDSDLVEELKEFVPNVDSRVLLDIKKMVKYDLPRFKEFKKMGIPLNHGRYTMKENETLRKNVQDFMALTGIDCATKLFFTHRFPEEQESIKNLKRLHKFFESIAEGIPRSCHDVYARGRRVFDASNHLGKFSNEELHNLRKLHTMYGNNWKKISELTGRSANSLEKRYSQLATKEGPWSKKEVRRLLQAVQNHIVSQLHLDATSVNSVRIHREAFYKKISWQKIAAKVKTRSWVKCREKWMSVLAVKMSSTVNTEFKPDEVKVKLIRAMYELQVDDISYVNWEDLTAVIGDVPPSFVQRKWHKMKICHVPNWRSKCFADIVDFLYEQVLPSLETALEKHGGETEQQDQRESYFLSDIFDNLDQQDE